MAKIVGYVKLVEGEYIAKSKDGQTRVLHKGDPVFASDLVFNPAKDAKNSIEIDLLSAKDNLKLDGKGVVYLEDTVTDSSISTEDMTLSQADVNSDLRDVKTQDDDIDSVLKEYGDIDIDETAIGKEDVMLKGHGGDQFAKANGAMADVNSDLRNVSTHIYNLEHDFDPVNSNGESGFSPSKLEQSSFTASQTSTIQTHINPTPIYNPVEQETKSNPQPEPTPSIIIPEISINDVSIDEQNGYMIFTVTSSAPIGEDIVFNYQTTPLDATSGADYTSIVGEATIKGGTTSTTIKVPIKDDDIAESNEKFTITLSNVGDNAKIVDGSGIGTIIDDRGGENPNVDEDATATLVISDAGSVNEADGNYLVYDVKLSNPVGSDIPVSLTTAGSATIGADYSSTLEYSTDGGTTWQSVNSTVNLPADGSSIKVRVAITDDYVTENDESIILQGSSNDPRLTDSSDVGVGTIKDDNDTIYLQLSTNATQTEAQNATLTHTITLVDENGNEVNLPNGESIDITLSYTNDTTSSNDFVSKQTTFSINGDGSSSYTFTNTIKDDKLTESNESYTVKIDSISSSNTSFENIAISSSANEATGTIIDDRGGENPNVDEDATATLVISDAGSVNEADGNYLVYDVKLSNPVGSDIPVSLTTAGSATIGADYSSTLEYSTDGGTTWQSVNSTVNLPADGSSIKVRVAITDDYVTENDESIILQGSSNDPRLTDSSDVGVGTIAGDNGTDAPDTVYVKITTDHSTISEDGGNITYKVSLVDENGDMVTLPNGKSVNVDINWSGVADASDTTLASLPNSITIAANTDHADIVIPIKDDYINEGSESLVATISGVTDTNSAYNHLKIANTADGYSSDEDRATTNITDSQDTIYVKLTGNDTTVEGGYLEHTVTLVDKDGNEVTLPAGKTITVDLAYSNDSTLDADFTGQKVTQVQITGGNSSATIQNLTKDDWIGENNESYTLKITGVNDDNHYYENVSIANTTNGYSSDADSIIATIQDGVHANTPNSANVDEDGFDMQNGVTSISDTESLNITPAGDSNYTLTFENSIVAKDQNGNTISTLKSDGKDISYDYSTDGKIVAKDSDGDKVFEIVLDKNSGSYTYTQYKNIDHPLANSDDNITLTFNYKINDADESGTTYSTTSSFDVTINDSMPSSTSQSITLYEDATKTIYISDENFKDDKITLDNGVDGPTEIARNGTIDIYDIDKDDVVGTLKNNGDGTLLFTPKPNYSGATSGFSYSVSDGDGDSASANVSLNVKPVADTPIMPNNAINTTTEDNNNTNEGTNTIDLGLSLPDLSSQRDQTDKNETNGASSGDAHERFGLLEFSFSNSHDFGDATLKYDSNGDGTLDATLQTVTKTSSFTIYITDVNEYHPADIGSGTYSLTQAQYESLAVVQAEDNANNIKIDIKTKMHEVDDSGNLLNPDISSSYTVQTVVVDVEAATDDISLEFDDDQNIGSISKTTNDNDTFTFDAVNEDSAGTLIDLKSLLTKVSGTQNDATADLDGSEHRWYEFSGLPKGSIITLGGSKVAVADDGTATIKFPDNTQDDPDFTLQIAPNYSGNVDATITLHVQDSDIDSSGANPAEKTVTLHLKGTVDSVVDDVTLQVKQASGDEDAGRSNGNIANDNSADDIDHPENGIPLDIKVTSSDLDGSETYTISIDKLPDGGSIYIADAGGTYHLYDKDSSNANNVTITDSDNSDGIYQVTITDYDNDKPPLFIPPHNSDEDYTFDIEAWAVDSGTTSASQTLQIDVQVNGVADIPTNTDIHSFDRDGANDGSGIYAQVIDENSHIDLQSIYKTYATLNSYDSDGSETLSVVLSDLPDGFIVSGNALSLGGGKYAIAEDDIDDVDIIAPAGYAGEADFKLTYVTTESEGGSKTHFSQDVKVLITPVAEATLSSSTNVVEDTEANINFTFNAQDSNEALENIYLLKSDVDGKDFTIKLDGNDLSDTETIGGVEYYKIGADDISNLTIKYGSDMGSSNDTTIAMKYTTTDTLSGGDISDGGGDIVNTSSYQDATVNFTLSPVTDAILIDVNGAANIDGDNISASDTLDGKEQVSIDGTGSFTANVDISAYQSDNDDFDTDGSEEITKLLIENVPDGISIENGIRVFGTNEATWIIDTSGLSLDEVTKTYNLTFKVNNGLYDGTGTTKDITITAFDKDGNSNEVSSNTQIELIDNIDGDNNGGNGDVVNSTLTINNPTITEDTEFSLGDFITVNTDPNDGAGDNSRDGVIYSVAITNLEHFSLVDPSSMLSYTDSNGNTFYIISGDESTINSKLANIKVIPDENLNSNNIGSEALKADIILNAYMDGIQSSVNQGSYIETSITPVTDPLTPIDIDTSINEDNSYTFDIDFNSVDNPHYDVSNVILHRSADLGVVKLSDGTEVSFDSNGDATIPSDKLTNLVFIPTQDISGQVTFSYTADVKERGADNTQTVVGGGDISIDIIPTVDGLDLSGLAANGKESDTYYQLNIGSSNDSDGSESVKSVVLDNVPDGFLVYYGDSGSETLALNTGDNGSGTNCNMWSIPVSGGVMPNIYIKAPAFWSAEVTNIELKVTNSDGSVEATQTQSFDLDVTPEANNITVNPTKTFGDEGEDIPLNLNANVEDLDGSESVTLTLKGFGDANATFKVDGEAVDTDNVSYDSGSDTYTITNINSTHINDVSVVHSSFGDKSIDFTVHTVDSATINGSTITDESNSIVSGSFDISISSSIPSSSDDILLYSGEDIDGLGGDDTLILNGATLDFTKVHNIETIDLSSGKNSISNITLQDVVDMSDDDNTLVIKGDAQDQISIGSDLSKTSTETIDGHNYDVYTNSSDPTVALKIDEDITVI